MMLLTKVLLDVDAFEKPSHRKCELTVASVLFSRNVKGDIHYILKNARGC